MGAPYSSQAISGYNANPPPDDGSTGADNEVDWSFVKTKIGDPIKTLSEAINTELGSAFGKVLGGVGVTSTAVSYTVLSADQGKLVRATASGVTITTPDATNVGAPFVFALLNNSSGNITFDGNGSQTIDGNASVTVAAGSGMVVFTDGTNWYTTGQQGLLVGKQLMYGDILNATISESNTSNTVTFALKTLAGSDPTSTDPIIVCFRNSTAGTGNYVYRTISSATSLTISSGSTLGALNSTTFRIWLVLFDDGGTIRLGAINPFIKTDLDNYAIASSTAEGGAGAADSTATFYTGTAVTNKPYVILGYAHYVGGLTTAGSWNVSPTRIQLYGHGIVAPQMGAAKAWVTADSAGNIDASYNVTSVTDTGTGIIDITIGSDFIGAEYCAVMSLESNTGLAGTISIAGGSGAAKTAGTLRLFSYTSNTLASTDPSRWHLAMFGDRE